MLPIRRLLLRDLLILMVGLSALLLGLSWWSQQQALERQAGTRAQTELRHLDGALRISLEASQSLGETIRDWWLAGLLLCLAILVGGRRRLLGGGDGCRGGRPVR